MGYSDDIVEIKNIYAHIVDENSKKIFANRLLYSITGDNKYICNMINSEKILEYFKKISKYANEGKKLIIFGAGSWAKAIIRCFPEIKWDCFADNDIKKNEYLGFKVIHFEELVKDYMDSIIVISPSRGHDEINAQLLQAGFSKDNIINFGKEFEKMSKTQYFEFPAINNRKESFVDAGCLDGFNSKNFVEWCKGNYSNIWAFEPDNKSYLRCKEELNIPDCKVLPFGLWDREELLSFDADMGESSKIKEKSDTKIKVVKLDDALKNEEVTFIKMDIEGAELNALRGAENIIKTQKPRLAICIYHKAEDIIEIPRLLLKYNPEYKFRLRHYSIIHLETVLYAE